MTWADPNTFRIDISFNAYRKMMAAIASTQQEVSGFGHVKVYERYQEIPWKTLKRVPQERPYEIVFRVEDAWLLDLGSYAETEISDTKTAKFYAERMAEGYQSQDFKVWWHRHPLPQGWSGTDEHCIRNTPMGNSINPKATGWLISLVWCTQTGWNGRFDQVADPGFTIHVPVTIDNEPMFEDQIQRDLDALTPVTKSQALSNYWHLDTSTQRDLFGHSDDDLPWWEYVNSEAPEVAEQVRDALLEIDWDRHDETVALAYVEDVADQIERKAKREGGLDQRDIEDIVLKTADEYSIRHDPRELLEIVRW